MKLKIVVPLIFLILFCLGLFLVGKGITAAVVSESCCFPPDCLEENLCDPVGKEGNMSLVSFGSILVLISAMVFVMIHNRFNAI